MKFVLFVLSWFLALPIFAQVNWQNVDSMYQPLPAGVHVYKTTDSLDGKPFIAFYVEAPLKSKNLEFTVDTSHNRRLTPTEFFAKNNQPLLVVNTTFFSFETNRSLNMVLKNGKILEHNDHSLPLRGKDTFQYRHPVSGVFGIDRKGNADIAFVFSSVNKRKPFASQTKVQPIRDSIENISLKTLKQNNSFRKWKMKTAVGGGPVIVQNGEVNISNNEELKFSSKTGLTDKHPRTLIGYTADNRVIVMAVQGRFPKVAEGVTLPQEAKLMTELGCIEALNLDGGGSSCMLVNGKNTIIPSDKMGTQRPVPAVFIIKQK